jgi:hypothetical protein
MPNWTADIRATRIADAPVRLESPRVFIRGNPIWIVLPGV